VGELFVSLARQARRRPRPSPWRPQSCSSSSTCRWSTWLFQYGGPRPGERRGTSLASPTAARVRAMLAGSLITASSRMRPWQEGSWAVAEVLRVLYGGSVKPDNV